MLAETQTPLILYHYSSYPLYSLEEGKVYPFHLIRLPIDQVKRDIPDSVIGWEKDRTFYEYALEIEHMPYNVLYDLQGTLFDNLVRNSGVDEIEAKIRLGEAGTGINALRNTLSKLDRTGLRDTFLLSTEYGLGDDQHYGLPYVNLTFPTTTIILNDPVVSLAL